MKKSKELLGLTVISIEDGKDLGRVSDFVVNPAKGAVEFLIIETGVKYLGLKVLPFGLVEGVGEHAVTVQSVDALAELAEEADIKGLLEKNVHVIGTRILTKKGTLIGTVSEFFVDDDSEGKISGCELDLGDNSEERSIIPAEQIITFGKDILVVNEGVKASLIKTGASPVQPEKTEDIKDLPVKEAVETEDGHDGAAETEKAAQPEKEPKKSAQPENQDQSKNETRPGEESQPSQAALMFEQRQRKYLLGRKVSKRIETDKGELIAEEDQIITEELLDKAKQSGKFAELSMNTKP